MKKVFGWVFHGTPIPVEALCEAVSLRDGLTRLNEDDVCELDDIMTHCRTLFRLSAHRCLESAHFTVVEFFVGHRLRDNPELCFFAVTAQDAYLDMAQTCLRYLTLDNFRMQMPRSVEECYAAIAGYPFYEYAAENYQTYLGKLIDNSVAEISSLLERLFNPQKTSNFVLWIHRYCTSEDRDYVVKNLLPHNLSPLHVAALLGPAYLVDWIIAEGGDVNVSNQFGIPLQWAIMRRRRRDYWRSCEHSS